MKHWKWILAAAALLLAMSCVVSRHPIYSDKDLVSLPGLAGTWADDQGETRWNFTAAGEKAFDLVYTEKGLDSRFEARPVKLGNFLFLDLYPKAPEPHNDFYVMHFLPAHTAFLAVLDGDRLTLRMPNINWLEKQFHEKKLKFAFDQWDDRLVLMGATPELQKLLIQIATIPDAFGDPAELKRVK
jgi:hypothetical protein